MNRLPALLLGLSLALAFGAAVLAWRTAGTIRDASGGEAVGGHFVLIDQNGHARTDTDFRGRWMLVYFGYTYCPDVCPTTLQDVATALHRLGPKAKTIVPLFITIDPSRDRPAVLRKYLASFGPEFEGLTGTPGEIAAVANSYHVYYARRALPGGGYSVDHASAIYLMNPDGQFVTILDDQQGAAVLEKELNSRV